MAKIKLFFKKLSKITKNNRGFSLAEALVTMSIVGSVASLAGVQITSAVVTARDTQRKANIHQVQTALNLYYDDNGQYPVTSGAEPTVAGWQMVRQALEQDGQSYINKVPIDPINSGQYLFKYWSNGQKFKITYETEDPHDQSPVIALGM